MTELDITPETVTQAVETVPFLGELPPWAEAVVFLALMVSLALAAKYIVRYILLRIAIQLLPSHKGERIASVSGRLANIVPALIIYYSIAIIPHLPEAVVTVTRNVITAFVILTVVLVISSVLDLLNALYNRRPHAVNRPIKGYIQLVKILLYAVAIILIVATLIEKSPLLLLSGLGAMAAILMLVFKDTILSFVASVQIASNDMLRVGDWIEMPQLNADGDVIDIALHTVKVQNWDKTITTIPTHRLISESYKNWRGMQESGGRRIKRALMIDQQSIRLLTPDEVTNIRRFALIDDYLLKKQLELESTNAVLIEQGRDPVNGRHLTNVGTFRAYVLAYLKDNPHIHQSMTLLVRQLEPKAQGLPLEVYCFTNTVAWGEYENIQSDIFDHLITVMPEFGLRLFQDPSGADMRQLGEGRSAEKTPAEKTLETDT